MTLGWGHSVTTGFCHCCSPRTAVRSVQSTWPSAQTLYLYCSTALTPDQLGQMYKTIVPPSDNVSASEKAMGQNSLGVCVSKNAALSERKEITAEDNTLVTRAQ